MPSDKEYTNTKQILLGNEKMKSAFTPLAKWIDETYDVKTINIVYDILENVERPRLQICFEFEKDKLKFLNNGITYFDKGKQEAIGGQFKKTIIDQGLNREKSISNVFRNNTDTYLTENIWVIYGAFEPIAKIEATSKIPNHKIQDLKKFIANNDIWEISLGFTVATFFLYTDQQLKHYNKPEFRKAWGDKYFELVKEYDEFGYLNRETTNIELDSKENFDKNFQSNWYYYYK